MRKTTGIAVTLATAIGIGLVTGPAQIAKAQDAGAQAAYSDIEQTLELGAHGPKGLAILIVRD